jgi:hypothetical protein
MNTNVAKRLLALGSLNELLAETGATPSPISSGLDFFVGFIEI